MKADFKNPLVLVSVGVIVPFYAENPVSVAGVLCSISRLLEFVLQIVRGEQTIHQSSRLIPVE